MGIREFLGTYGTVYRPPSIAGTYHGGVVVCGDAACLWEDLAAFDCAHGNSVAKDGWDFLTINSVLVSFPGKIEHCYSNSGAWLGELSRVRRHEYVEEFGPPKNTHAINQPVQWVWPWSGHGTSGLGAVLTAVALGYEKIVLCGIPLDNGPHNGEPHWRRTGIAQEASEDHWGRAKDLAFGGKVKSMSGRTQEWLGAP